MPQLLQWVGFIFLGKVLTDLVWLNSSTHVCCQNLLILVVSHEKEGNHCIALGDFGSIKGDLIKGVPLVFTQTVWGRTHCFLPLYHEQILSL